MCHHARMTHDESWLDPTSAWWAKAERANFHLFSLHNLVTEFRASEPYRVIVQPTDAHGRTAYRLRIHQPMPVEISTTVGDVLHNLRSALDSLAYEIARRGLDRPMTTEEEQACAFPIRDTPESFDKFFDDFSKNEWTKLRCSLYPPEARTALRSVQPFSIHEEAIRQGVKVSGTCKELSRGNDLHRLAYLSNLDKHRRLTVVAWWPNIVYWMSNGPSKRRWLGGDGTFTDGSILGYMVGKDVDMDHEVFHVFNLVLSDDPAHNANDLTTNTQDMVAMLAGWHRYITGWVFGRVIGMLS